MPREPKPTDFFFGEWTAEQRKDAFVEGEIPIDSDFRKKLDSTLNEIVHQKKRAEAGETLNWMVLLRLLEQAGIAAALLSAYIKRRKSEMMDGATKKSHCRDRQSRTK